MNCSRCNKSIVLAKVDYNGQSYHSGCFSCGACKKGLKNKVIKNVNGIFYDEACYEQYQDDMCAKCGQLLTEGGLVYNGKNYHEECFVCKKCNKSLSGKSFNLDEGEFYDSACFNELNSMTCDQCKEMISGNDIKYITYLGKFIHKDCFKCFQCHKQLSCAEKFRDVKTTVKGALICIPCSTNQDSRKVSSHVEPALTYMKR